MEGEKQSDLAKMQKDVTSKGKGDLDSKKRGPPLQDITLLGKKRGLKDAMVGVKGLTNAVSTGGGKKVSSLYGRDAKPRVIP